MFTYHEIGSNIELNHSFGLKEIIASHYYLLPIGLNIAQNHSPSLKKGIYCHYTCMSKFTWNIKHIPGIPHSTLYVMLVAQLCVLKAIVI